MTSSTWQRNYPCTVCTVRYAERARRNPRQLCKRNVEEERNIEGLVNRVVETKLASALKTQVTLENKNISAADFNKMFE